LGVLKGVEAGLRPLTYSNRRMQPMATPYVPLPFRNPPITTTSPLAMASHPPSKSSSTWASLPRWVRLLFLVAAAELVVCVGLLLWVKSAGIL